MPLRLDRREGQSITVPGDRPSDDVVVVVHSIRGDRVRLEVVANHDQAIYRTELFRRLEQQETTNVEQRHGR
jgi:sRNA-binding carbon storage regulator CsrA